MNLLPRGNIDRVGHRRWVLLRSRFTQLPVQLRCPITFYELE